MPTLADPPQLDPDEDDADLPEIHATGAKRALPPSATGSGLFGKHSRLRPEDSLAALRPDLARQWDAAKNGALTPADVRVASSRPVWWNGQLTPRDVTSRSNRSAWWRCPDGHEWEAVIAMMTRTRTASRGCPFCAGKRVSATTSLAARFPDLAREWHPTRNGDLTPRHQPTRRDGRGRVGAVVRVEGEARSRGAGRPLSSMIPEGAKEGT
jgi:hypothetical protein